MSLPSVVGEVIAGILIGPSVLGIIKPDTTFYLLAEAGILLLLFEVGMETDVGQLVKVGIQSFLVALTGVLAPALFGFWISNYVFNLSLVVSLFVSGTLVATSIGITMRVLSDLNRRRTGTARIVLGAAVLDDVIGVIVLALLYDFAVRGEVHIISGLRILGFITVFLLLAPVITKLFVPLISKVSANSRTKGMIPTIIVSIILLLAVISHKAGAPEILGSFAAGVALARRFFLPFGSKMEHYSYNLAEKIDQNMRPIINLFVPIFFVIVGASINLKGIDFSSGIFWRMVGFFVVAAIVAKILSGIWVRGSMKEKLATGIAMVPRGEVGLIFAEIGRKNGIFDDMIYAVMVFVVAMTTLFAPLVLRIVMKREE